MKNMPHPDQIKHKTCHLHINALKMNVLLLAINEAQNRGKLTSFQITPFVFLFQDDLTNAGGTNTLDNLFTYSTP